MQTYTIQSKSVKSFCGEIATPYFYVRDKHTIVEFSEKDLDAYFQQGLEMITPYMVQLQDTSVPMSEQNRKEILFMMESLVHAREEIDARRREVQR
jgi:hypothetical protein